MKKLLTAVLTAAMVFTMGVPFAFAADSTPADTGTQQTVSGPVLENYSVQVTNTDPVTEKGQEIIVNLDFSKDLKTDDYTKNAFNVTLSGNALTNMGYSEPDVSVSKSDPSVLVLDIKASGSGMARLVNARLGISLKSNYYEDITDLQGNAVPSDGWTNINTVVPGFTGVDKDGNAVSNSDNYFVETSYTPGNKASGTKESVTFRMAASVKLRGMNHIQILSDDSIETGNTIISNNDLGYVTIHSHSFTSQTNADYVKLLTDAFNSKTETVAGSGVKDNIASKDYTMSCNADTATPANSTITITANEASDTKTLENAVVRPFAYNTNNDYVVQQAFFKSELDSAQKRLAAIDDRKVASNEKAALTAAVEKATTDHAGISGDTTALEYNQMRNALRSAVNAAADNAISTDSAERYRGEVSLSLTGGDQWLDAITGIEIDGTAIDSGKYSINKNSRSLVIDSLQFKDPERSKVYTITIHAKDFDDVKKDVTINFYGAQTLQVRHLDAQGNVLSTKTYTKQDLINMSDRKDHYFTAVCTMRGITAFKGEGVTLEQLFSDAGIKFAEGMDVQLRTNDNVTGDKNDPTDENAYYRFGRFSYEDLTKDRYYLPDVYDKNSDLYKAITAADGKVTFESGDKVRQAAAASPNKVKVLPMINYEYAEKSWTTKDQESLEKTDYNSSLVEDMTFRFNWGVAIGDDNGTPATEAVNTLRSSSYQVFGVDVIDSTYLPFNDVSADRWSRSAIQYAYNNGLFYGTNSYSFDPQRRLTRGMAVTVLYRLDGSPAVTGDSPFTDVSSNDYYANAVKWASDNGITAGISSTQFAPGYTVTREQFVSFLYRYANYKKYTTVSNRDLTSFTDANQVAAYAVPAMRWAYSNGIISGTTATTLDPRGVVTREQAAAMIMRFANQFMNSSK